jgi:hypothetical protein
MRQHDGSTGQNSTVLHYTAQLQLTPEGLSPAQSRPLASSGSPVQRSPQHAREPARHEFEGSPASEEQEPRRARRGESKTWGLRRRRDSTVLRRDRRNRGRENTERTQREYDTGWTPADHREYENTGDHGENTTEYERTHRRSGPTTARSQSVRWVRRVFSTPRRRIRREHAGATPTRRQRCSVSTTNAVVVAPANTHGGTNQNRTSRRYPLTR